MSLSQRHSRRLRAALVALCAAIACLPPAALGQTSPAGAHDAKAQGFAQHVQAHLDELAARLEIKASQEGAWQAFSSALRDALIPTERADDGNAAGAPLDAAGIARRGAERAAARAQKLARLSDATAKLQQALAPDQRLVLNEAARRMHERMMRARVQRDGGHERDECRRARHEGAQRDDAHERPEHGARSTDPDDVGAPPSGAEAR